MIPIKNFKNKKQHMAKQASTHLNKKATLVKNFKMPVIQIIADRSSKKKGQK